MVKKPCDYARLSKIKGFRKKFCLGWLQVKKRLKDLREESGKKKGPP
jgi:hypothetical protein